MPVPRPALASPLFLATPLPRLYDDQGESLSRSELPDVLAPRPPVLILVFFLAVTLFVFAGTDAPSAVPQPKQVTL
jgi:hypothetical protein